MSVQKRLIIALFGEQRAYVSYGEMLDAVLKIKEENERLQKASRNLIDKLNKIQNDSNYIGIFQMADIHGLKYNGENYSKEYDELFALLKEYGEDND